MFLGATKHLYNWLCPLVGWSVGRLVGWLVTHLFNDPLVAPYWPTWPCFLCHSNTSLNVPKCGGDPVCLGPLKKVEFKGREGLEFKRMRKR